MESLVILTVVEVKEVRGWFQTAERGFQGGIWSITV